MPEQLPRPVRSVLVVTKHKFMGDTIVAVPMLRAAHRVFPDAHVTLLTGEQAAIALENCPFVHEFVCYAPRDGKFQPLKLRAKLRAAAGRPDLCLIADRSFRSAMIALLAGGRVRAGFDTEGRGFLLNRPVPYRTDTHEAECCLDILRAVAPDGGDTLPYDAAPQLWTTEAERKRGGEALHQHNVAPGSDLSPLVGVQPGASYAEKQWPAERFAEVADSLTALGARIVLIGAGEREKEAARMMKAAMRGPQPADLTGATRLRDTMGVLTHLSLFIGNDTGVNHIAASLGVPTVGLFGPTSARKWGNAGPRGQVIAAPDDTLSHLPTAPVLEAASVLLRVKHSTEMPRLSEGDEALPSLVGAQR